jgi:hypothetical protein
VGGVQEGQRAGEVPGVPASSPQATSGAPGLVRNGDTPADRRMPFATIVTKDYDGFDTASNLNRPGVFRLNIAVGRTAFEELLGHPPAHSGNADHTAIDTLIPHPVYATQGWVAIINPGMATAELSRSLLTGAHTLAVGRHRRRAS